MNFNFAHVHFYETFETKLHAKFFFFFYSFVSFSPVKWSAMTPSTVKLQICGALKVW